MRNANRRKRVKSIICDKCRKPAKKAGRVSLVAAGLESVHLDVCEKHAVQIRAYLVKKEK